MQLEIDRLKRKLRHEWQSRTLSFSDPSSNDGGDSNYRPRLRTPPSESFSYEKDSPHSRRSKNSSCKGLGNDAMSRALNQISRSPFTCRIEGGKLPRRFTQPTLTMYSGRTDLVEHVIHFNQRMVVHSRNEALMCKIFPSSLGPMAMRWSNKLGAGSIDSFKELTRAFGSRFITSSRVPRPLDSLLSMTMQEGETLKTYSDRYWEMFNEIDEDFDNVAIRTFKVGLLAEHDLRKSLTKKPVRSVRRLMDRIVELKRAKTNIRPALSFSEEDKIGTTQPHDDTLVVTLRIGGYDVKRVMVDQGSGVEIMYPDLYKGLNLKLKDLTAYNSPLISFNGKVVIPKGQIRLPVQVGLEVVEVDFIMVDAYSPYTAIVARPWFHTLGAVSSTLHLKVKYPSSD
ncbi:uncharacterized protein LOC142634761 [Castanea sativa]|uniref:uncharacterized protein LOC142634761 n=1 Tax=Castanea sativa TaxID=21020 RepID=UPI003F649F3E